jgi:hypothetical protein
MNVIIIVGAIAFFGLAHSLTAGQALKNWMLRVMGERAHHGLFRLLYNALSVLTIAPALLAVALLPGQTLYSVGLPWSALLIAIQSVGGFGLALSLLLTDLPRFTGLSQMITLLNGKPLPMLPVPFRTNGPYELVRHPLYFFSLLLFWASPVMTVNTLLFNLGATAYFLIGTYPEERKLLNLYGERYRAYQQRVPRLLPFPRPRQRRQSSAA